MSKPRVLTDEELETAIMSWHEEDHKPGTLAYLCAIALNTIVADRKKAADRKPLDDMAYSLDIITGANGHREAILKYLRLVL